MTKNSDLKRQRNLYKYIHFLRELRMFRKKKQEKFLLPLLIGIQEYSFGLN